MRATSRDPDRAKGRLFGGFARLGGTPWFGRLVRCGLGGGGCIGIGARTARTTGAFCAVVARHGILLKRSRNRHCGHRILERQAACFGCLDQAAFLINLRKVQSCGGGAAILTRLIPPIVRTRRVKAGLIGSGLVTAGRIAAWLVAPLLVVARLVAPLLVKARLLLAALAPVIAKFGPVIALGIVVVRRALRGLLGLPCLLLGGHLAHRFAQKPGVMLGMLHEVFGGNPVIGQLCVPAQLLIFLNQLLRCSTHLAFWAGAVEHAVDDVA